MDYLKMLSVILDPLSGPSWWLSLDLIFLIIIVSSEVLHNSILTMLFLIYIL